MYVPFRLADIPNGPSQERVLSASWVGGTTTYLQLSIGPPSRASAAVSIPDELPTEGEHIYNRGAKLPDHPFLSRQTFVRLPHELERWIGLHSGMPSIDLHWQPCRCSVFLALSGLILLPTLEGLCRMNLAIELWWKVLH